MSYVKYVPVTLSNGPNNFSVGLAEFDTILVVLEAKVAKVCPENGAEIKSFPPTLALTLTCRS